MTNKILVAVVALGGLCGAASADSGAARTQAAEDFELGMAELPRGFHQAQQRELPAGRPDLLSGSMLGRPAELAALLPRKDFGKSYVQTPLVRAVLESPAAVKAVLGSAMLRRAFFGTAAMNDPKTVNALGESALLMYVMSSAGVRGALQDPAVYQQAFASPETLAWAQRGAENRAALGMVSAALARDGR